MKKSLLLLSLFFFSVGSTQPIVIPNCIKITGESIKNACNKYANSPTALKTRKAISTKWNKFLATQTGKQLRNKYNALKLWVFQTAITETSKQKLELAKTYIKENPEKSAFIAAGSLLSIAGLYYLYKKRKSTKEKTGKQAITA